MRNLNLLDIYRRKDSAIRRYYGGVGDSTFGFFSVPSPIDHQLMAVVASSDEGWDHVSVSRENRCPNWPEMDHVRRLFFRDEECAMQLHPPVAENISIHPYCLHIWRPQHVDIPRPPSIMVGPSNISVEHHHEPDRDRQKDILNSCYGDTE